MKGGTWLPDNLCGDRAFDIGVNINNEYTKIHNVFRLKKTD